MSFTPDDHREAQAQAFVAYVRWFKGWSPPDPTTAPCGTREINPTYGSAAWYDDMYRRSAKRRQAKLREDKQRKAQRRQAQRREGKRV
ncbi:hypothetical protein PUR22_07600 [Mycolicibacterium porcinum]|uniref:hypothetical protein n=1 Tax=Mycolicibacterium porcinum TaxID=39693 RepID=UPI0031FA2169